MKLWESLKWLTLKTPQWIYSTYTKGTRSEAHGPIYEAPCPVSFVLGSYGLGAVTPLKAHDLQRIVVPHQRSLHPWCWNKKDCVICIGWTVRVEHGHNFRQDVSFKCLKRTLIHRKTVMFCNPFVTQSQNEFRKLSANPLILMVPAPRFELGTWWLQINCSTNWAIPA